ncbi:MAG: sensor histidine kinase [Acidobacteriota bacterium]
MEERRDPPAEDHPEFTLGAEEAAKLRQAERAFLDRPLLSIRARIAGGFLLCFLLVAATAAGSLGLLHGARSGLSALSAAAAVEGRVHGARSHTRDFFREGKGIEEARREAEAALDLYHEKAPALLSAGGPSELALLGNRLRRLAQGLAEASALERFGAWEPKVRADLEASLERDGAEALEVLESIAARESERTERILVLTQLLPFASLALLLGIIYWVVRVLGRTISLSLDRFRGYTRRIAAGDFSPITPAKPYRDEFSDLALAVNRMLFELRAREAQVTRAGKLAALGTFTAGIAHELNNPLNNISITVEALLDECRDVGDARKVKLLTDVFREAQRADAIVRGLLDFTRDEPATLRPLRLAEAVEGAADLLQNEMALAGVAFTNLLPQDLPEVEGDFDALRQLFLNLFLNAVQAMPKGGRLVVNGGLLSTGKVRVEVTDEGTGIPPEALPHLFDPFFTTKERGKGTGLGLAICHGIVRRHGGEIHVDSVPGRGTTVRLLFPAVGTRKEAPP